LCAVVRAVQWKRDQPFPCGHPRTPENTRYRKDGRSNGCATCPSNLLKRPRRAKEWSANDVRVCRKCGVSKAIDQYYFVRVLSTGHRYPDTACKACWKEHYRQNPRVETPEQRARKHRRKLLRKYGLSEAQLVAMEERANGRCEICGKPGKRRKLALDHDHQTGKARGFLCTGCNTRLGWLELVGLDKVVAYLIMAAEQ
jgi:hypothetical protein